MALYGIDDGQGDAQPTFFGMDPEEVRRKLFPQAPPAMAPGWLQGQPPAAAPAPAPANNDAQPQTAPLPRERRQVEAQAPDLPPQPITPRVMPVPAQPTGPNLNDDAANGRVAPPNRNDPTYAPEKRSVWNKIRGAIASGAAGLDNPAIGYKIAEDFREGPQRKADAKFAADETQFNNARNSGVQAHQAEREDQNDASRRGEEDAQKREADARTFNLQHPPAPKPERPENIEQQYSDAVTDAITRGVDPATDPKVKQLLTAAQALKGNGGEGKPNELQEDQKFEDITRRATQHQAVTPDEMAWAKAYRTRKTLGQQTIVEGNLQRDTDRYGSLPRNVIDTWNGNRPVVVSARDAENNPDRYVNATQGAKAVSAGVTADDIQAALENVKKTSRVLDGGIVHRAEVATALDDPHTTKAGFAESVVAQQLSPPERDYVISVLTAREVVPGLRGLLGTGQATDDRVRAMQATLPGSKTPSSKYANAQIDSALATLKRVRPAILNVKPQNNPSAAPSGDQGGGAPQGGKPGDPLGIF